VRCETSRGGSGRRVVQRVSCCVLCFVFFFSRGEGRCIEPARGFTTGDSRQESEKIVRRHSLYSLNASMNKQKNKRSGTLVLNQFPTKSAEKGLVMKLRSNFFLVHHNSLAYRIISLLNLISRFLLSRFRPHLLPIRMSSSRLGCQGPDTDDSALSLADGLGIQLGWCYCGNRLKSSIPNDPQPQISRLFPSCLFLK